MDTKNNIFIKEEISDISSEPKLNVSSIITDTFVYINPTKVNISINNSFEDKILIGQINKKLLTLSFITPNSGNNAFISTVVLKIKKSSQLKQ